MLPPLDGLERQSGAGVRAEARLATVDVGADDTIWQGGAFHQDTWSAAIEGEPLPSAPVIVSKKRWRRTTRL